MKLFIIKSVLFLIFVGVLFQTLDVIAVSGLSKLRDDDYKDLSMLYNNEINEEMLIFGSSRSWNHFDIHEIEKLTKINTRVIGLSGADFNMQRALWEPILNQDNDIKYFVHVVGALEFGQRNDGILKKYKFIPYLDNDYVYNSLLNLDDNLWKDQYFPLYKFHGSYKYFFKGIAANVDNSISNSYTKYKGFQAFEGVWDGKTNIDKVEISNANIVTATQYIREEAQLALERGKVLILVYTPESDITNSMFDKKSEVIEILKGITADFNNVYFLNYENWYGNTNKKLFKDPIHLNSEGAKLFSKTFAEDVLNIIK